MFLIKVIDEIVKRQTGVEGESISKCLGIQVRLRNALHDQNCSCSPSPHCVLVGDGLVPCHIVLLDVVIDPYRRCLPTLDVSPKFPKCIKH